MFVVVVKVNIYAVHVHIIHFNFTLLLICQIYNVSFPFQLAETKLLACKEKLKSNTKRTEKFTRTRL